MQDLYFCVGKLIVDRGIFFTYIIKNRITLLVFSDSVSPS